MSVTLSPHSEALIRQRIEAGRYGSVDEVIEDAMHALDERDKLVRLRAAIAVGDAQLARGEGVPFTPELMDEIEREAEAAMRRGDRPRSDVTP